MCSLPPVQFFVLLVPNDIASIWTNWLAPVYGATTRMEPGLGLPIPDSKVIIGAIIPGCIAIISGSARFFWVMSWYGSSTKPAMFESYVASGVPTIGPVTFIEPLVPAVA